MNASIAQSPYRWIRWIAAIAVCGCADSFCLQGIAQTPDAEHNASNSDDGNRGNLIRLFTEARNAFSERQWSHAAQRFRQVSQQCQGSQLALESNYFAMVADWKDDPSSCKETVSQWLQEAKGLQGRMARSKSDPSKSFDDWVANAQLILAQRERQNQEWDRAEERLKALLQIDGATRDHAMAWPETIAKPAAVWYELGLLLTDTKKDLRQSAVCFQHASEQTGSSGELHCAALAALARAQLALEEYVDVSETIERLEKSADRDEWRIRAALLRSQVARARNDAVLVADSLKPAVEIALAGRTDLLLLYELALALLDAREDARGEALLVDLVHRDANHPLAVEARIRLARQESSRQQWEVARTHLDEAMALGCTPSWIPHARLARGQVFLALGLPQSAHDDLVVALQYTNADVELETAVRFELAESLVQLQRWNEAKSHWDTLVDRASRFGDSPPAWLARVWLHQAELQAIQNDWDDAEQTLSKIRAQFPECDCRDDVDYVRARCLISKAQFDEARQLLQAIASNPQARSSELVLRSWWMIGETYLMQRRHAEALHAYEQVLGVGDSQYWHSAAWMQMGQCYELLRDVPAARNAYRQILDRDLEGPFGISARERIATLPETPPNAPVQSSARTFNDAPGGNKR